VRTIEEAQKEAERQRLEEEQRSRARFDAERYHRSLMARDEELSRAAVMRAKLWSDLYAIEYECAHDRDACGGEGVAQAEAIARAVVRADEAIQPFDRYLRERFGL
jgi:hypothetical protein